LIPFASSRGLGQDLATHLQNAQDNEYVEIAELSGAVARDLHGAFAEWEFQADALTRCKNYLYSLSLNPDPAQGRLTREQYLDYIERTEDKLGLAGQPRAIVYHIKNGREHCHVVWSRINAQEGKAVHLAFDRDKLMMVTREFARDHGLRLPDGYSRDKSERRKSKQASLYEMHQQRETGLSKAGSMAQITQAWRGSDNAKAFVSALSDLGYMLARGNRPYVLVDIYGHVSALPRMIDDRQVRAKDVQAFLSADYPADSLPSVEEAKKLAAEHRKVIKTFEEVEDRAAQIAKLEARQTARRDEALKEKAALSERHRKEKATLATRQLSERRLKKAAYLMESRRIRERRARFRPTGLAAFLGRVSGVELIRKKLHKAQDRRRYAAFLAEKEALADAKRQQTELLTRRHESQALVIERKLRGLDKIDKRERQSLETSLTRQGRQKARGGNARMPSLALELKPKGRRAAPHKAKNRHKHAFVDPDETTSPLPAETGDIDLTAEFDKVAGSTKESGDRGDRGESGKGRAPRKKSKIKRYRPRRNRDRDRGR
jgi:hypothetical protein